MASNRKSFLLKAPARLCCLGGGLVLLTVIAFVATAIYEWIVPPTDMHLPGLLTAAMLLYVAPIGGIIFIIGGTMWIGVSFASRKKSTDNNS